MARVVKAKLGEDLRRVTVQPGTEIGQLRSTLCHLFAINPPQTLKLRYADEEGDLITLSSDVELQEAFSSLPPNATLKLELELISLPSPPSSSPPASASASSSSATPLPSEATFYPSLAFPSLTSSLSSSSSTSSQTTMFEQPPAPEFTVELKEEEEDGEKKEKGKEAAAPEQQEETLPAYQDEGIPAPVEKGGDFLSSVYQEERGIDFGFLLNEFHYHRLIIQTACRAGFDSLIKEYEEHHKAKVQEMWSRASVQSAVLTSTIERTFDEWKRDVSEYPPAQDISSRVSEALKGVETFTAPIIENIRVALLNTLEKIFNDKPPASLTSSEIVREMETFHFTSSPLPANAEEASSSSSSSPAFAADTKMIPADIHTHEEEVTGTVGGAATVTSPVSEDVQVVSSLSGEFVYVPEQPEQPEEPFAYTEALSEIVSMGFTDLLAIKAALVAHKGDVNGAINSLL